MRFRKVALALAVAGFLGASGVTSRAPGADEEPKYPEVGSLIPGPFHALNLTGDRKGRYHCLVCRYGLHPVTALFVRLPAGETAAQPLDPKGPLVALLQKLNAIVDKNPDANFGAFVVLMGDEKDREAAENAVADLVKDGGLKRIVFVWEGTGEKSVKRVPEEYQIKEEPNLTVLIYSNYRVIRHQVFADQPPTEAEIDALAAEFLKQAPPPFLNRKKR